MNLLKTRKNSYQILILLCTLLFVPQFDAWGAIDRAPVINIILIDDKAIGLPQGGEFKRNNWVEWQNRLPTFLDKLKLVAEFRRATGDDLDPTASLYTLEVASSLSPERTEEIVESELNRIHSSTKRPSAIIARGSAGKDQLRIVFQDSSDYLPSHAAKFLRVLSEISPSIAYRRIAENFGPFNAPPTLIFDPRIHELCLDVPKEQLAKRRWGVLEETYLLPHYVLHILATLNTNIMRQDSGTFYVGSVPERGAKEFVTIYWTDKGINQWQEYKNRREDHLSNKFDSVFPVSDVGKILFLMPYDKDFPRDPVGQASLRKEIQDQIELKIKTGLAQGIHSFEIRTVQMIGTLGYFEFWDQQPKVKEYTRLFLEALNEVKLDLEKKRLNVQCIGGLGSNGAYVGTENIPRLSALNKNPINSLILFDGRAYRDSVQKTIDVLGGKNVKIVNSGGDAPALPDMVGNLDCAKGIKRLNPGTSLYWVDPKGWNIPFTGHLSGMKRDTELNVKEYIGDRFGYSKTSKTTGADFIDLNVMTFLNLSTIGKRLPQMETGGILFDKGNIYSLDLSGHVRILGDKAVAALDASGDVASRFKEGEKTKLSVGIPMGSKKRRSSSEAAENVLIYQRDLFGKEVESLPFGLARFRASGQGNIPSFGGGWTFEPLVIQGIENIEKESISPTRREVTLISLETGNHLSYLAEAPISKERESSNRFALASFSFKNKGGDFQPDLLVNEDGTLSWILRHGVVIDFNQEGFVKGIRQPGGESVHYIRLDNKIVEKRASNGRSLKIEYVQNHPVRAIFGDSVYVQYGYESRGLVKVKIKEKICSFKYDDSFKLSEIREDGCILGLKYNPQGKLIQVSAIDLDITLESLSSQSILRISDSGQGMVEWHFRPNQGITGVTRKDSGILWTRSSDGRITQMALGSITLMKDGYRFQPIVLIGALP
jgi:hypothetical protein